MSPDRSISTTRRVIAVILGIVSLLCTLLWLLVNGFVAAQVAAGVYDGPMLLVVAFIPTFVPVVVCTILALILVGPSRSKLAWMSLYLYFLPFALTFRAISGEALRHMVSKS